MKAPGDLHDWQVTPREAAAIQLSLAARVSRVGEVIKPNLIAGSDVSVNRVTGTGTGAVVVLNYPALELVEAQVVTRELSFPYVPGLLSFRESPLVLAAWEKLTICPDLLLVDGHGLAHPRRMGLASHLGLLLGMPTIGCAKSRLCGAHEDPGAKAGSYSDLVDDGEVIGAVVRTKDGVRPIYVSNGHRVDLAAAVEWALKCCRGHRLPEPCRLAHLASIGQLQKSLPETVLEK